MKSIRAKRRGVSVPGALAVAALSAAAAALGFTSLGLGFVNLAVSNTRPAPAPAPPEASETIPVRVPEAALQVPVTDKKDEKDEKELATALAKVNQEARDVEQDKRKLALQQQTLAKSRGALAVLDRRIQDLARQAGERTKGVNPADLQRLRAQSDAGSRLADARRQSADLDRRVEELRQQVNDRQTLFDPQRLLTGSQAGEAPQWVECARGAVILIPQGDRIAAAALRTAPAFTQAVAGRYVVFLVRPNGYDAFNSARSAAEEAGAKRLGYEPIDQNWQLKYR